ncbi:guanine permease [Halodesulfovibrio spirochaetisodalis]|uniref:Guanine permease n=2 Tax=Halodesulfovibrio spirochaetisodalis TaxID=1560234 RepID=A0A1B7XN14_9BACT|nr:guanine permease [Halodesulfovibrio spirochaetisodalis]
MFKLSENGTTVSTEVTAGLTTFMTMAYILAVNPAILGAAGMDPAAVFTASAVSAVVGTLIMALFANLPFALAPGMGLNAFFAYTVVLTMGYSWQTALTAVFLEGIIFLILTGTNIREAIVNSIPVNLKRAISAGIGFFIALIGFKNAGIVVSSKATLVAAGDIASAGPMVCIIGLIVIGVLFSKKIKGALLIGMFVATVVGIPLGVTDLSTFSTEHLFSVPSLSPLFMQLDFSNVFSLDMLIILFTFLFVDMFDTVGTLIGVTAKANMLDERGRVPNAKQALFADAIATTAGACLGTSTVTTFVESAAGVAEGGRTGLTAFTTAILFALALLLAPLFLVIPAQATAPALITVGMFMMSPIREIDLDDYTEAIPAFLCIVMMPYTFSIAEGIIFGLTSFVVLKLLTGRRAEIPNLAYILVGLFVLKFLMH